MISSLKKRIRTEIKDDINIRWDNESNKFSLDLLPVC